MDIWTLHAALDQARLVVVEEDLELVFVWHGSSLVNVLGEDLEAINVIGLRGNDLEGVTAREVREVIDGWILAQVDEEGDEDHA